MLHLTPPCLYLHDSMVKYDYSLKGHPIVRPLLLHTHWWSCAINTNLICPLFPHFVRQHEKPSSSSFPQILTPVLLCIYPFCESSFHSCKPLKYFPNLLFICFMTPSCSFSKSNPVISGGYCRIYSPLRWCLFFFLNCVPLYLDVGFYQFPTLVVTNYHKYSGLKQHKIITIQFGRLEF